MLKLALCSIAIALLAAAALAQPITYEGCVDVRGIPVASVPHYGINDSAIATLTGRGEPVIYYNPNYTRLMSRPMLLWGYAHECGHHALGHTFGSAHPLHKEQQSDCFGIVEIVRRGLVNAAGVRAIQHELSRSPGDWNHLPGPARAVNLERCLAQAGVPPWGSTGYPGRGPTGSFCDSLSSIISTASRSFRALRGPPDGTGHYVGRVSLPGTRECIAWADEPGYTCASQRRLSLSAATRAYESLASRTRGCLSSAWSRRESTFPGNRRSTYFERPGSDVRVKVSLGKSPPGYFARLGVSPD